MIKIKNISLNSDRPFARPTHFEANRYRIKLYSTPLLKFLSIFPSIKVKFPTPDDVIQPHTITLPPQCFTVLRKLSESELYLVFSNIRLKQVKFAFISKNNRHPE